MSRICFYADQTQSKVSTIYGSFKMKCLFIIAVGLERKYCQIIVRFMRLKGLALFLTELAHNTSNEQLVVSIAYLIRLFGYLRCIGFYLWGDSGTLRLVRGKKGQGGWAKPCSRT